MPFISRVDRENQYNTLADMTPSDELLDAEAGFSETFAAGVGFVIDEELSISSQLNMQGYGERDAIAETMRDDGFDFTPYTDNTGVIDYNRLSQDTDFGLKSDLDLYQERNALLESRRNYSDDVKERGSGMAQFAGGLTGYMMDPVNIATLPLGAAASSLRGLSTLARVKRVAAVEAAIATTTELAIQPLVYAHKNEIGSPYQLSDALTAIGTAAVGAGLIGGAATGVAGFFRSAAKMEAPDTPGVVGTRENLNRVAGDIEANPARSEVWDAIGEDARHFFGRTSDEITEEIDRLSAMENLAPYGKERLEVARAVLETRKGRSRATVEGEIAGSVGTAARKERATKEGFDTEQVRYHGTGADVSRPRETFWTSETPELANEYAALRGSMGGDPNVMPVFTRASVPFDADKLSNTVTVGSFSNELLAQAKKRGREFSPAEMTALKSRLAKIKKGARVEESGPSYSRHDFWMNTRDRFGAEGAAEIKALMDDLGYDSITMTEGGGKTTGILSPDNVRSAFDNFNYPKKLQARLKGITHESLAGKDIAYYRTLEETRKAQAGTMAKHESYQTREDAPTMLDEDYTVQRYEAARAAGNAPDNIALNNGLASAKTFIDDLDRQLEGLESVKVCVNG